MKMQLIFSVALIAASAYAHDFKTCGTDGLGVATVDVTPDSPIPGANLTVSFTGTPTQDVNVGDKLTITVKVFGVALGHVDFDFCKDLGVTCPVKAGTATKWDAVYPVPKAAPGGVPLTAEFTATSTAGQYSCIDVAVTMGKPPAATPLLLVESMETIAASTCHHHNDVDSGKCYEACGEGEFKVPKLEADGACGDEYTITSSSSKINQCSDGVTNVKYCKGGDKRVVALTVKTKGLQGECFHAVASNKCSEACAESMFKMTGVTASGPCPSLYKVTEKTQHIESCSDGVTNAKYCSKPLYLVNVTVRIKGEGGVKGTGASTVVTLLPEFAKIDAQTSLYKISGDECGQATLDSKYASYAEKFAGLSAGTCASQGYTVADGTQTLKVPVLGDLTISKFKKATVVSFSD